MMSRGAEYVGNCFNRFINQCVLEGNFQKLLKLPLSGFPTTVNPITKKPIPLITISEKRTLLNTNIQNTKEKIDKGEYIDTRLVNKRKKEIRDLEEELELLENLKIALGSHTVQSLQDSILNYNNPDYSNDKDLDEEELFEENLTGIENTEKDVFEENLPGIENTEEEVFEENLPDMENAEEEVFTENIQEGFKERKHYRKSREIEE